MSKTLALMTRELRAYFYSPVAYVALVALYAVLAVFLLVPGLLSPRGYFEAGQPAEMRAVFDTIVYILVFIMPILTMRLLSEEMNRGTIETLMTAPVTDTQVVLGKYLGAMGFYLLLLAPSLLYLGLLLAYGNPDAGMILAGYLGLVLIGMVYTAVGLFTSTCTRYDIVSAIIALAVLITITFLCTVLAWGATALRHLAPTADWARWLVERLSDWGHRFFEYINAAKRYQDFSQGKIAFDDVTYFLVVTALVLFITVKVLESRKWRA
jgi:ABC-2 type transport system permease protein